MPDQQKPLAALDTLPGLLLRDLLADFFSYEILKV